MGKGDNRRPCCTGKEEQALRESLAWGLISRPEFDKQYAELKRAGRITRHGRRYQE